MSKPPAWDRSPGERNLIADNPATRCTAACSKCTQRSGVSLVHTPRLKDLIVHGHENTELSRHCHHQANCVLQIADAIVSCRPAWPHRASTDNRNVSGHHFINEIGHFFQSISAVSNDDSFYAGLHFPFDTVGHSAEILYPSNRLHINTARLD